MPRISEFYGIAVYLYYRDHAPPHFHAIYADFDAEIEIATAAILDGKLPRKAIALVAEWAELHRHELEAATGIIRPGFLGQPLQPIEPLE